MDSIFKYALIFSILFHTAIIIEWPMYRYLFPNQNQYKDIEITYLKINESTSPVPIKEISAQAPQTKIEFPQPTRMVSEELSKGAQPQKSSAESPKKDSSISPETKKETVKVGKMPVTEQKPSVEIKHASIQKLEGITSVDSEGLRPVPPSYAQAVRNKIRKNLEPTRSGIEGDVFVRFMITSDGELQELSIIDEKSTKNGLLREVVFEAIKNSSPFPSFPRDFATSAVTFTCQISFELK